jgi:hypothetical protein
MSGNINECFEKQKKYGLYPEKSGLVIMQHPLKYKKNKT